MAFGTIDYLVVDRLRSLGVEASVGVVLLPLLESFPITSNKEF